MSDIFVKTKLQEQVLAQLEKLIGRFAEREPSLDALGSFPFENIQELKEIGYTSLSLPKEYGGEEISLYDLLLFQEKIAEGDGSTALSIGWHMSLFMELTEHRQWEAELFSRICGEVRNGALLNRAATERGTGSPTRGGKPETTARKEENQWVINGRKTFTSLSPVLDYFIVTASVEGSDDIAEFLIPRGSDGVVIEETWDSVALRGTASHDLVLKNVHIPLSSLVETKGAIKKHTGSLLHIPACYLGIARAARNYAIKFAKTYHNNSTQQPIASLPSIQRLIGEMELELMQARHLMYSTAAAYDTAENKDMLRGELAAAKHTATNTAISVVDKAMRIVGARSLSEKNPLQRYYLHVRAGLHNPPADDITIALLAKLAVDSQGSN
ncbi:acyl-CoA dehydrogenase family protein [Ectobacillus funiculus]|uniref:acyl-CoA dehydrogenase family protein n=1 Tax=Ectobacillus funiculus TaxID=137993 RepID=UPI00101BCFA7|nr:acyl-CoA dehydrogenase family protein [Ectobacillus funiculus]